MQCLGDEKRRIRVVIHGTYRRVEITVRQLALEHEFQSALDGSRMRGLRQQRKPRETRQADAALEALLSIRILSRREKLQPALPCVRSLVLFRGLVLVRAADLRWRASRKHRHGKCHAAEQAAADPRAAIPGAIHDGDHARLDGGGLRPNLYTQICGK